MRMRTTVVLLLLLSPTAAIAQQPTAQHASDAQHTVGAQHAAGATPLDADRFVEITRAGIARFRDRSAAIAAGYRRLGPAFPGMGEHWIHPGLIVRDSIIAGTPSVLCYAEVDGRAQLIGAAYAFALTQETPLPELPGGAAAWHMHGDAVDEETLLLVHPRADAGSGTRLVMTHVWTELANPAGVFAQNNWALPFAQAGQPAATVPTRAAAQALSLLTTGPEYYEELFDALADPTEQERVLIAGALDDARAAAAAWRESRGSAPVDSVGMQSLEVIWIELWRSLDRALSSATTARLRSWQGA